MSSIFLEPKKTIVFLPGQILHHVSLFSLLILICSIVFEMGYYISKWKLFNLIDISFYIYEGFLPLQLLFIIWFVCYILCSIC